MKTWSIALKDTLITFRDRNALLLMIAAPLLISFVMGMAFGGQAADVSPISQIPLILVNTDAGTLGQNFTDVLYGIEVNTTEGVRGLFNLSEMDDLEKAKHEIEMGRARGVVFIPPNFSENIWRDDQEKAVLEVYTDPTATISPAIIRSVVNRVAIGFNTVVIGNTVTIHQILDSTTNIQVAVVNDDTGPLKGAISEAFAPQNFEGLFVFNTVKNLSEAEQGLADGDLDAVIYVTDQFSERVLAGADREAVSETVHVISQNNNLKFQIVGEVAVAVARGFASDAANYPEENPLAVLNNLENLEEILSAESENFGVTEASRIRIHSDDIGDGEGLNLLNYFVPSMAIFFLLFTVFGGTRSILDEERDGTLHRLMSTPTSKQEIILGKILGTFMTGILQFVVLVAISGLVFNVDWGRDPIGIALMVLGTVSATTSLGAFIASFARNVNQAGVLGSAITLIFAILGGNFIDFRTIPAWLTPISRLTINRWALEGFFNITLLGEPLVDVLPNILVLFGMAFVYFSLSIAFFNRRFVL